MPFALTLLGTDTSFAKVITNKADYPKGETLSLANLLIEKQPAPQAESDVEHICNLTHTIIDGPTTLGSEVYQRMNLGLFRLLNAVASGQTDLQIIAHSRGACEAILVSHEFDRIKQLFTRYTEDNIATIQPEFMKNIVKNLKIEAPDSFFLVDNLISIKTHINSSKLSLFLLDPVPGGSFLGIHHLSKAANYLASSLVTREQDIVGSLKWDDPLFYHLPECVEYLEQFVFENEHTRCFKPIVPVKREGMAYYQVRTLPGHHGTGSGNPYDQQKTFRIAEYDIEHTLGVQKLIFSKLIKFLKNKGHTFDLTRSPEHSNSLTEVATFVLDADERQYRQHLASVKQDIFRNLNAYEKFNQTSYAYLGQEYGLSSRSINTKRVIHFGSEKDTLLFDALPSGRTTGFLDWEHIELEMQLRLLGDFNHLNPTQCIKSLREAIEAPTETFKTLKGNLLIAIINNLSHAFINDELKLSHLQISEFLTELDALMTILRDTDLNLAIIVENALSTYLIKKTDRLVKSSNIRLNRRDDDIEKLTSMLSRDKLTAKDKLYIETNLSVLRQELPIQLGAHPATPIGEEAFELLKCWATEEEISHNRLTLQELCSNYKKLLELKRTITYFAANPAYNARKFKSKHIDDAIDKMRMLLLGHIRKNDFSLNNVHDCFDSQEAYESFAKWFLEEHPNYLNYKIIEPLKQLSTDLTLLQKNLILVVVPDIYVDEFYQHYEQQYDIRDIEDSIKQYHTDSRSTSSFIDSLRSISASLQQHEIETKLLSENLNKLHTDASFGFSFIPAIVEDLQKRSGHLRQIEQLLLQQKTAIDSQFIKVRELNQKGEVQISALKLKLQELKTNLFAEIDGLPQNMRLDIEYLRQVIQQTNTYIERLQVLKQDTLSALQSTDQQHEIDQRLAQLTHQRQETQKLLESVSELQQFYVTHSLNPRLDEFTLQPPVYPQQINLDALNRFYQERTAFKMSARQHEVDLQQQIEKFRALMIVLRKQPAIHLMQAEIDQQQNILDIYTQRLIQLQQKIQILPNDDQVITGFYDQWLKQLRDETEAYQAYLNMQASTNSTTLLERKKTIVTDLLVQLNTANQPSYVNIQQFQQQLQASKLELAEHRDPSWQRYLALVAKCALVFALMAGSIMLGLTNGLALGIAVAVACTLSIGFVTFKKYQAQEHFSFFNSNGQMFSDKASKVQPYAG
jgi:hypothetical protein